MYKFVLIGALTLVAAPAFAEPLEVDSIGSFITTERPVGCNPAELSGLNGGGYTRALLRCRDEAAFLAGFTVSEPFRSTMSCENENGEYICLFRQP